MTGRSEVALRRRLLAFLIDHGLIIFLVMIVGLSAGSAMEILPIENGVMDREASTRMGRLIDLTLLGYCLIQFAYQYWSLLTGNPTVGQTVAKFYVDAKARNFQPGFVQMYLSKIGVNLIDRRSPFWPATVQIVLASLTLPLWPFVIIEALINSEHRFWWARISETTTVDMKVAFRKIPR